MIPQDLWAKCCVLKINISLRAKLFVKYFSQCHLLDFKLNLIVPRKHSVFDITHQEVNFRIRLINETPKAGLISLPAGNVQTLLLVVSYCAAHLCFCFP